MSHFQITSKPKRTFVRYQNVVQKPKRTRVFRNRVTLPQLDTIHEDSELNILPTTKTKNKYDTLGKKAYVNVDSSSEQTKPLRVQLPLTTHGSSDKLIQKEPQYTELYFPSTSGKSRLELVIGPAMSGKK